MPPIPRAASRILMPLALVSCLGLSACATLTGGNPRTEMVVANHTTDPIMVAYTQSRDNTASSAIGIEQKVLPDSTIRFSGKAGDTLLVRSGDEPPLTLVFARRSQVVKVSETSTGVTANVRQGYTDPNRR